MTERMGAIEPMLTNDQIHLTTYCKQTNLGNCLVCVFLISHLGKLQSHETVLLALFVFFDFTFGKTKIT